MLSVILAVDGSPSMERTVTFARGLLANRPASITVLHVIPLHILYSKGGAAPEEVYDMPEERAACTRMLNSCAEELRSAGVGPTIATRLVVGDAADQILGLAETQHADLVVLGSRGLNAMQRFLLGSVSTKVAAHAPCAVLVVHPKEIAGEAAVVSQTSPNTAAQA